MKANYVNQFGVVASGTDRRTLPEAELWTQVILQAINDLHGRTSLTPGSAKDSAREWFASDSDSVGSFIWTCQIINVDPNFIRSRLAKKLRMKNPVEVVKTSRTQRMKTLFDFTSQRRSRLSQSGLQKSSGALSRSLRYFDSAPKENLRSPSKRPNSPKVAVDVLKAPH